MKLALLIFCFQAFTTIYAQFKIEGISSLSEEKKLAILRDSCDKKLDQNFESGIKSLHEVLGYCKNINWENGIALSFAKLHQISMIYRNKDSADKYNQILLDGHLNKLICIDYMNYYLDRSNLTYYSAMYDQALVSANKALKIADSCGLDKIEVLSIKAGVYNALGKYEEAVNELKKSSALAITQKDFDSIDLCVAYFNIGVIYGNIGEYDSSNLYLNKSKEIYKYPNVYVILCNNLMKMGASDKEIDQYFDSATYYYNIESSPSLSNMYNILACQYYSRKGEYGTSIIYAEKLIKYGLEKSEIYTIKSGYQQKLYAILGDSLRLLDDFIKYNDSIRNQEVLDKTIELETKFKTAEKEQTITKLNSKVQQQEIDSLKLRNYILFGGIGVILLIVYILFARRVKRRKLRAKVEELRRQALKLQMNPHFFFNSLNSVNNFIVKNEKIEAQKFLTGFSRLMRLTLENSQEDLIPIQKEKEFLERYIDLEKQRLKNFDYTIEIDESIETNLIPSFLIQPLVENSILHGFRDIDYKGELFISFSKKDDKIRLVVRDNGKGKNNSSKKDTNHKSYATKILKDRIAIHKGVLIENTPNENGHEVIIELPQL